MSNHIMIDLETIGTKPGSAILTIGAVRFDPFDAEKMKYETNRFYRRIDRASCQVMGLTEDTSTAAWWAKQSEKARFEAFDAEPRENIMTVMSDFVDWCGRDPIPWSHGATFDVVLIEHVLNLLCRESPWKFWNIRDTRTLYDFTGVNPKRDTNHHHALHDAIAQAEAVCLAYRSKRNA